MLKSFQMQTRQAIYIWVLLLCLGKSRDLEKQETTRGL